MGEEPRRIYAVTGAAGFIGGRLSLWLLERGHRVVAIVRKPGQGAALAQHGAQLRVADVRDPDRITAATAGVDGIFHLAALFNHPDRSFDEYRAVNIQGAINVLDAALKNGIPRVVKSSTVGVATEAAPPPWDESTPYSPMPGDKYEETKAQGEQAARDHAADIGQSLVVIRPAQVYGPGDLSKKKFYKLVKKGVIVDPGTTRRHLIHVDDLCRAFCLAMTSPAACGEVFLIANRRAMLLKELISITSGALNVPEPRVRLPAWPVKMACAITEDACNALGVKPVLFRRSLNFFTRSVECDVSKAQAVLGFQSQVPVEDGIRQTVAWYQAHGHI